MGGNMVWKLKAPGGTAGRKRGQRSLMQGEVIPGKAPHCSPRSPMRQRRSGGMRPAHNKIQSHYPHTYVDRIATVTKKKSVLNKPRVARKCDIVTLDGERGERRSR
ncbi:unnamed protein product [Pleuronectes platessa]|uniref:Uncharacterized protein n=1 Tax=Pleuronectes platessa TaxID=8262 RepID=A0A9N7U152_PLEPL|nr:unnamed protein product [Pleuronectes platessa]